MEYYSIVRIQQHGWISNKDAKWNKPEEKWVYTIRIAFIWNCIKTQSNCSDRKQISVCLGTRLEWDREATLAPGGKFWADGYIHFLDWGDSCTRSHTNVYLIILLFVIRTFNARSTLLTDFHMYNTVLSNGILYSRSVEPIHLS